MAENFSDYASFFCSCGDVMTAGRSLRSRVNRVTLPEINKMGNLLSNSRRTDMCHFLIHIL